MRWCATFAQVKYVDEYKYKHGGAMPPNREVCLLRFVLSCVRVRGVGAAAGLHEFGKVEYA